MEPCRDGIAQRAWPMCLSARPSRACRQWVCSAPISSCRAASLDNGGRQARLPLSAVRETSHASTCHHRAIPLSRQGHDAGAAAARRAAAGGTMPFDRAYAIENGPGRFDPANPKHLPKINFLMLMRNERLASLRSALRRRDADADDPARRQAGGARRSGNAARAPADRAVHRRLHAGRAARRAEDRRGARPQLLGRVGQVPAHRQSRERARAGTRRRPADRSAALPRQRASSTACRRGPSSAGSARICGSAVSRLNVFDRTVRCEATNVDPQHGAARHGDPRAPATHAGATPISASTRTVDADGEIAVGDALGRLAVRAHLSASGYSASGSVVRKHYMFQAGSMFFNQALAARTRREPQNGPAAPRGTAGTCPIDTRADNICARNCC